MAKTITLKFDGYWRDVNRGGKYGVPNQSGIYLVYRCIKNVKPDGKTTVTLKELIYIGEAGEVQDRTDEKHEKRKCWEGELKKGEEICFSFAPANKADRERAESALIYKKKSICNDQGKDSFSYEQTTVNSSGKCEFIPETITVEKTK